MFEIAFSIFIIALGLILLSKGADFLVGGASRIAKKLKIPEIIIGLTIVAIGTSLPELIVSVTSAIQNDADISISNVIGSNFANLFLIISLCAVIKPLHIRRQTRRIDQPLVVVATLALFLMIRDNIISKEEGWFLLGSAVAYIIYTIIVSFLHSKFKEEEEEEKPEEPIVKTKLFTRTKVGKKIRKVTKQLYSKVPVIFSLFVIALGAAFLKIGGDFTIDGVKQIALAFNVPSKIIGFTIVALGTSLPELITCVKATKAGEPDLAIGNIVGSQLFNIVLVLGCASSIVNVNVENSFYLDTFLLLIGNIIFMLIPGFSKKHEVGRIAGVCFVVFYFVYIAYKCIVKA
ncbi:MAG: calcium/sodium antiporter [Clostridia bacterium]|nr:calcium/sodium antiporter [Clostridia bacterium]